MHTPGSVAASLAICLLLFTSGAWAALSPSPHPAISSDQAVALASNRISEQKTSVTVENHLHNAVFTSSGLEFKPARGPQWSWILDYIGPVDSSIDSKSAARSVPFRKHPDVVAYEREGVTERYLIKRGTIEQQFVIAKPLKLRGKDLLVSGHINSPGQLAAAEDTDGWLWHDAHGAVRLGQVTVFDASGKVLPAKMKVAQDSTRIVVDGKALAGATYPVTIDPEIGSDFRISDVNGSGVEASDALTPDVAYNPDANEYLVVWWADEDSDLAMNDFEIYGQRIDAQTGADVGENDFRISTMGDDGNSAFRAEDPAVAYNPDNTEYLVVWQSDHNEAPLEDGEFEIFGRRIDADGTLLGAQTRISFMGGENGDINRTAANPDVCYNSATQQYLVVWDGDDNTLPDGEVEIFARLVGADGALAGSDDIRVSDMGTDRMTNFAGVSPAVACNDTNQEYYVVWWGDDTTNQEFEIFAQRLDSTATPVGDNDKKISDMGTTDGDTQFAARFPDVAYNAIGNQYLVVWQGDDDVAPLGNDEFEIFGQLINAATGDEIEPNDFRISFMGGDEGNTGLMAALPATTYNPINNEYFVAWEGDDDAVGDGDDEIFATVVNSDGTLDPEVTDLRLSDMFFGVIRTATDPSTAENAGPALSFNSTDGIYLATWEGDDNLAAADGTLVDDEFEIFGQLVSAPATLRITDSDSTVGENAGNVSVTVERVGDLTEAASASFAISGADAADYTDLAATASFAAGSGDPQTVEVVTINDDSLDESDETLTIALSNPSEDTVLAATGTSVNVTITDNDGSGTTEPESGTGSDPVSSSDGDGGGGCALRGNGRFDPLLPMLVLFACVYFLRRRSALH